MFVLNSGILRHTPFQKCAKGPVGSKPPCSFCKILQSISSHKWFHILSSPTSTFCLVPATVILLSPSVPGGNAQARLPHNMRCPSLSVTSDLRLRFFQVSLQFPHLPLPGLLRCYHLMLLRAQTFKYKFFSHPREHELLRIQTSSPQDPSHFYSFMLSLRVSCQPDLTYSPVGLS